MPRTGSVPFWLVFNTESSAQTLERYLSEVPAYDDIGMFLFSHGTDSIGPGSIERWRMLARKARIQGTLLGVDERAYPRDFATLVRYHQAIKRVTPHYPLPPALTLEQLRTFIASTGERYHVKWEEAF